MYYMVLLHGTTTWYYYMVLLHGTTPELQSRNDAYPTNYPPVRRVERGRRDDLSVFSEFVSCITRKCGKTHLERYEAQQKEKKAHVDM